MSGMDNILSKMYAKNSDFQEIVDKYIITGGGNQRTGTAASTAHPDRMLGQGRGGTGF